jgi:hypothetical protein
MRAAAFSHGVLSEFDRTPVRSKKATVSLLDRIDFLSGVSDGSVGAGAAIRLREYLGANPRYGINVITEIERLDEQGFVHNPRFHGISGLARMEYRFTEAPDGTLYENWLIVGAAHGCKRILNPLIKRLVFDRSRGLAWIRHNIEEVGMLENILPSLYAAEHSRK